MITLCFFPALRQVIFPLCNSMNETSVTAESYDAFVFESKFSVSRPKLSDPFMARPASSDIVGKCNRDNQMRVT